MVIAKIPPDAYEAPLALVRKVFSLYEAPDYGEEGVAAFEKSISDPDYLNALRMYGAYEAETLLGVIATRREGQHIALLFVGSDFQKKGVGKALVEQALRDSTTGTLTVNSSPFALPFYHRLGFWDVDREQSVNGLHFTPMINPGRAVLETRRLILRPWEESDAEALYLYAKDPRVGPAAGWQPHTGVENSRQIIRNVLSQPETYAAVLKETGRAVGSVGIMLPGCGSAPMEAQEAEIGYWIGVPYWGQGLIPEAVRELQRRCFEDFHCKALWCGYYEGNEKSHRVQEKCGFIYDRTEKDKPCPLMGDVRTEIFSRLTREAWYNSRKV